MSLFQAKTTTRRLPVELALELEIGGCGLFWLRQLRPDRQANRRRLILARVSQREASQLSSKLDCTRNLKNAYNSVLFDNEFDSC